MYKILKLFTVLAVVFAFSPVSRAQTVVDGNTAKFLREFDDKKIKPAHIDTSYWSTSKEIRFALGLNATSDNWHQSSDMSFLQLNVFSVLGANYKREYTNWQNVLDIRLGFTWKDAGKLAPDARNLSVAENYLRLETQYGVKIVRRFDFAANAKLVTQIMPSYEKENSKDPNKKFMAPGVIDVGKQPEDRIYPRQQQHYFRTRPASCRFRDFRGAQGGIRRPGQLDTSRGELESGMGFPCRVLHKVFYNGEQKNMGRQQFLDIRGLHG